MSEQSRFRQRRISLPTTLGVLAVSAIITGGCPRPEDIHEQNDSPATATPLTLGVALIARVVQGDPDMYTVDTSGGTLRFELRSIGEEEERCAAFRVVDPAGAVLYSDISTTCSRGADPPTAVAGATLDYKAGVGYVLRVPAAAAGRYVLEIRELGYADNVFTYSWLYTITAAIEE